MYIRINWGKKTQNRFEVIKLFVDTGITYNLAKKSVSKLNARF
jgi:hypothetical protein